MMHHNHIRRILNQCVQAKRGTKATWKITPYSKAVQAYRVARDLATKRNVEFARAHPQT